MSSPPCQDVLQMAHVAIYLSVAHASSNILGPEEKLHIVFICRVRVPAALVYFEWSSTGFSLAYQSNHESQCLSTICRAATVGWIAQSCQYLY
jgi:hypothetical protein